MISEKVMAMDDRLYTPIITAKTSKKEHTTRDQTIKNKLDEMMNIKLLTRGCCSMSCNLTKQFNNEKRKINCTQSGCRGTVCPECCNRCCSL